MGLASVEGRAGKRRPWLCRGGQTSLHRSNTSASGGAAARCCGYVFHRGKNCTLQKTRLGGRLAEFGAVQALPNRCQKPNTSKNLSRKHVSNKCFGFSSQKRKNIKNYSPSRSAWWASSWLPVSTISIAFDLPTARMSRCVPPQPVRPQAKRACNVRHKWGGGGSMRIL